MHLVRNIAMNLEKLSLHLQCVTSLNGFQNCKCMPKIKFENYSFTCIMITLDGDMTVWTFSVIASLLLQFSK